MPKKDIVVGLDIGTDKIKVAAVSNKGGEGFPELIFQFEENSDGLRRGTVVDVEKLSNILIGLFERISQEMNKKIGAVYVNINGSHLFSTPSRGLISVSRADQRISDEDIQRVLQESQAIISLSSNKEIFDVIPKEFIVDGERGIKNPLGIKGVRLETDVLALGGFSPYLDNLKKAILKAKLEILDMIPSVFASASAVLTPKQKELGVCVLDIGAGTTGMVVFNEETPVHFAVLPIGSANITNDIAIGLQTDIEIAEQLKLEYGGCFPKDKNVKRKIDIGEDGSLVFSQKFLTKIISQRMTEIFDEVKKELRKVSKEKQLPAGVVLTGGGSKLPGIVSFAKDKFRLPCRLGKPNSISGMKGDQSLSTVAGLVLMGFDLETEKKSFTFEQGIGSKIKKLFKIFIP